MDPITIALGVISLGSALFGLFQKGDENAKLKQAADLAIDQEKADLAVQQLNQNYGLRAEELKSAAEDVRIRKALVDGAIKQAAFQKKLMLLITLICLAGALFMLYRNRATLTTN